MCDVCSPDIRERSRGPRSTPSTGRAASLRGLWGAGQPPRNGTLPTAETASAFSTGTVWLLR